jgi:hypothetical protein
MLFLLCVLCLLCLLCIMFTTKERFQNILVTRSEFSQDKLTLTYDAFDINDEVFVREYLANAFPLILDQTTVGGGATPRSLLMIPQSLNLGHTDMSFVISLYNVSLTMLLPVNSKFSSFESLHNLVIGTIGQHYSYPTITKLLEISGLRSSVRRYETYDDLDEAWGRGEISAIFLLCSHPNPFVEKFSFKERIKFMDWSILFDHTLNSKATALFYFPNLVKTQIPLSTYRIFSLTLSLPSYGFKMNILCDPGVPDHYTYNFVSTIYRNHIHLILKNRFLQDIDDQIMSYCPSYLQYHPGAKAFYVEKNFITELSSPLCSLLDNEFQCTPEKISLVQSLIDRHTIF